MRQHLIEVLGLKKSFHGTAVLRGIDLAVNSSQLTVLIGPSGCGKSTLLRRPAFAGATDRLSSGTLVLSP